MKTSISYSLKQERLAAERQQSVIRILLCITTSLLLIKFYFDQFTPSFFNTDPVTSEPDLADILVHLDHVVLVVTLFMVYSLIVWALLKWKPETMRAVMVGSSVIELGLITFLMNSPAAAFIPFYLWYIFYVATVATRYGWKHSLFALAASFVSFTWTVSRIRGDFRLEPVADLGFMTFLLLMAFMFGRISEKQSAYQASLAVVNEFRADLAGIVTSREIVNHLLDRVRDILKVEQAWFLPAQRGSDGSEAPGLRSVGADPVLLSAFREGGEAWNVETVLENRQAILSNKPKTEPLFPTELAKKLDLRSIAAAPLMVRTTPVGVVYAANRKDHTPIPIADLQLLELMAIQTAPVVENAILWERLRESAALEERARIARDLHDNFLQTLAAIKIHLERCKLLVQKDSNRAIDGIDKIHDIATKGLGEVRAYLSELRMMGPEPSRFKQAVEKCSADIAAKGGFEAHVDVHLPDEMLPPNVALSAFQVLRELLNNAASHSQAEHVQVRVSTEDGKLVLEIEDDGVGFEITSVRAEKASQGHMGLMGVEERLKQSGGSLVLASEPGKGTLATAVLSLDRLTS